MNTLDEKDIDIFFNQRVFINSSMLNTDVYVSLMIDTNLKIQTIHYEKLKTQFIIYTGGDYSEFTINESHPFYGCIFNHIVAYKLSDREEPGFAWLRR